MNLLEFASVDERPTRREGLRNRLEVFENENFDSKSSLQIIEGFPHLQFLNW